MINKKLFFASLGISLSLSGMILEAFLMVLLKKLELIFFLYFDFVFYLNLRTYMLEKYRLEGKDKDGFHLNKRDLNIYYKQDDSTYILRMSDKILVATSLLLVIFLVTLILKFTIL